MKVATRLGLMAIGATAVFLIIGITSFISVSVLIKANQWVSHSKQVLQELNMLLYNLSDTVSTQRAYMITRQEEYLDAYHALVASTNESIGEVQRLVSDNPKQLYRARQLSGLIKERLAALEITTKLFQEKGAEAAFTRVKFGKSLQFRHALHKAIDEMKQDEISLLQARSEEMQRSAESSQLTVIVGACLGLVLVSLFSYLFGKYILNSIAQLIRASDNIRYGRFDLAVSTDSNDEFAELAIAFNTVGQQLMVVTKKLTAQEKEIEEASRAVAQAQEEIAKLNAAFRRASEISYAGEDLLEKHKEQVSEIREVFSALDDIGIQLENILRNNSELAYNLEHSRQKAEESTSVIIETLNSLFTTYDAKKEDLSKLEKQLGVFQDSIKSFDNLVTNLEMLSITAELEKVRSNSNESITAVWLAKLKDVLTEAKSEKAEFCKQTAVVKSQLVEFLKLTRDSVDTIAAKKTVAERIRAELSKQADWCRDLSDNRLETAIEKYTKLLRGQKLLPSKIDNNLANSKEYADQLRKLLRERNQASEKTELTYRINA